MRVHKNRCFFGCFMPCCDGVAGIELALSLPILLILFFSVIGISDYIRTEQKVETTIIALTDVVSQFSANATTSDISSVTNTIPLMLGFAYNNATIMNVIFTDVQDTATGGQQIAWQYNYKTPATSSPYASTLGTGVTSGSCLNISGNSQVSFMKAGDEAVFGEIYYQYQPIYSYILGVNNQVKRTQLATVKIGKEIFFLPRYANLQNVGFNTPGCTLK